MDIGLALILFLVGVLVGLVVGILRTVSSMERSPEKWIKSGIAVFVRRISK
jgi:uncharacterized protein YneF (UPF0154 family)